MAANAKLNAEIEAAWGFTCDAQASLEEQLRQLRIANEALRAENARLQAQLADSPAADTGFRPKGWYTAEDISRELGPAVNETHLCKRLGLTGTRNTRLALRRKMEEAGLRFWAEEGEGSPGGRGGNSE